MTSKGFTVQLIEVQANSTVIQAIEMLRMLTEFLACTITVNQ